MTKRYDSDAAATSEAADDLISVTISGGKYTMKQLAPGKWTALRYGEEWPAFRDSDPDNLHVALALEVAVLRERLDIGPQGEDAVDVAESAIGHLRHRISTLESALLPFVHNWADEHGWTENACQNDRIVDWFGPSDFRAARAAGVSVA